MAAAADPPRRCFVALPLPDAARTGVAVATDPLRDVVGDAARWTDPATLHLTLRFLGDTAPADVDRLVAALRTAAGHLAPCDFRLAGAGTFPSPARPRVLWIGVDPTPTLLALHQAVEDACDAAGLGRERRPFRPHLTVGRPRLGAPLPPAALAAALAQVGFVAGARAGSFHLMASELTRAGARHTPLAAFALGGADAPSPAASGAR